MRLVLRENRRYSSFEFLLICLREQKLLGRSRNRPLEGNNKYKNTLENSVQSLPPQTIISNHASSASEMFKHIIHLFLELRCHDIL